MPAAPVATLPARRGSTAAPAAPAAPSIPFTRAAFEHIEGPFSPASIQMNGVAHAFQFPDVPSHGYMADIVIMVTAAGGDDGNTDAVAAADAPWNVLDNIQLVDTSLVPIVGPLSGYDLYLINLLGGYDFSSSIAGENGAAPDPTFTPIDVDGNFTFTLRIPVQLSNRDAVGALANQTASAPYRLTATLQPSSVVYSTPPDTLPVVTVQCWLESWSQPAPMNNAGGAQTVQPPALGTTQFWSVQIDNLNQGYQDWRLQKMGYLIRTVILQFRDADDGDRDSSVIPPSLNFLIDGQQREAGQSPQILRQRTYKRTDGIIVPAGVLVYDFTHELSGHIGDDLRDLLVPTTPATNWRYQGTLGGAATLRTLINDVSVPAGMSIYLGP
jgi:hypothetical protein